MSTAATAILRICGLALLALAVWLLCLWGNGTSAPSRSTDAEQFSSMRADAILGRVLGLERPHPVGSAENAAVRWRIMQELAALHVPARAYTAFTCNAWRGFSFVACATVTDIIADALPGEGKAIVMMAHYDSVPAGPGASDDQSGVATILETIRALKSARVSGKHPVVALFTDGEEAGLLGAKAFLDNPKLKARVGAVANVEARGTSGQSLLFQTSPGDARLIGRYAQSVPVVATSSLYGEIYKFLPNDTDLTLFIRDGFPSLNYAFVGDVRYYHSPRDRRSNLSLGSLQMHGDNLLATVRALERSDLGTLKSDNAAYLSVLGVWLPRIPDSFTLPLSIFALFAIVLATWLAGGLQWTRRRFLLSAFMPLAVLVGCIGLGFALAFIAQIFSGMPDPTYAYPLAMRIALAIGVWGMTLAASRMTDTHGAVASAWLWMATLAVITAAVLPGLSPYFLFPSLVAATLLLAASRVDGGLEGAAGQIALLVSAVSALLVWFGLAVTGEALMGLKLHPLFTVPAAFGLMTLVPLLVTKPMPSRIWSNTAAGFLIASVVGAAIAGLLPSYSAASPQRLNLLYFENDKQPARWIADTAWKSTATEPLPAELSKAARYRFDADAYSGLALGSGYVTEAGQARYPLPAASITGDRKQGAARILSLSIRGSQQTDSMTVRIPKQAGLKAFKLRGETLTPPGRWSGDTYLICSGRDCRDLAITLISTSSNAFTIAVAERRYGLPEFSKALATARPATAMPSQSGDGVILAKVVTLPAR